MQSLLGHLISALKEIGCDAGVDGFTKASGALYLEGNFVTGAAVQGLI